MYKYIEVVAFDGKQVVMRMDVTGKPERQIDRIESGININLNHEDYYTTVSDYETEQQIISTK